LTLQEEIELSKSIEQAETGLLDAIARSRVALDELEALCSEVEQGLSGWPALLRIPPEKRDGEQVLGEIAGAVASLKAAVSRRHRAAAEPLRVVRQRFIATLLRERLSRQSI